MTVHKSSPRPVAAPDNYVPRIDAEEPIFYLTQIKPPVLTGRRAQSSVASIMERVRKHADPDAILPVRAREQRRHEARAKAKNRSRGQATWRRQELARERVANDIAQLLNIIDGLVPARPEVIARARVKIVKTIAEFQATDTGDPISDDEVESRLREIAKKAPVVTPSGTRSARMKATRAVRRQIATDQFLGDEAVGA